MQFVYVCRDGENEELRYSIRSVLKFYPDAEIWVVGGKPSWYNGNYIPVKQTNLKYENVNKSISIILDSSKINNQFVYMNDDFFFTKRANLSKHYYRGTLESRISSFNNVSINRYQQKITNLANTLRRYKINRQLDYELHIPILVEKQKLEKAYKINHLWRSVYGNMFLIPDLQIEDSKYYAHYAKSITVKEFIKQRSPFLSSEDDSIDLLINDYLSKKFPDKTIYEK